MIQLILKSTVMVLFLCLSFELNAETNLKFGGVSTHTTTHQSVNSFHRTAIISHNNFFAGYFKNSFYDDSYIVGYSFIETHQSYNIGWHVGAVYGYRKSTKCYKVEDLEAGNDPKIFCPMVAPEITFTELPLKPSVAYFGFDAIVLSLNYTF